MSDFCLELVDFTSEEDIDLSLPRISTAIITALMPAYERAIRFGWDARQAILSCAKWPVHLQGHQ